jgi:UDP:flavonoid glycosyltransferase YjiC (YdhE family)
MRVLFTVFSGTGHFHPLVPLARALETAGHQVAFAALADGPAQPFAAQVVEAGFVLLPVGSMRTLLANPEVQQWVAARATDRVLANRIAITRMFPEVLPCALLADLVELADRWNPDLIVSDNFEFAGRVVAESREVPHASLKVSEFFSYLDRHVLIPQMDVLRAGVGLPPDPDAEMQFRYMYLVDDPPGFDSGQILPPTTVRLRRTIFDGSVSPDWLSDLAPRPTVYATAGTNVNTVTGVLERLLEALRDEPINLILTVGHARDPAEFGPQPSNVHIERYLSQSLLMPYCDAAVVHGGTGTVYTAIDHGMPLVVVPIGADQFVNAQRCAAVGAGIVIEPEHRTPEAIRDALREVLHDPSYREAARHVQEGMRRFPTPAEIVPLLERLALDRRPVRSNAVQYSPV